MTYPCPQFIQNLSAKEPQWNYSTDLIPSETYGIIFSYLNETMVMNKDTTCKHILHANWSHKWNLYNRYTHSLVWNWVKIYEVKVLHTSTLRSDTWIYPSCQYYCSPYIIVSLRPRQNRRHFADDISKCIFLNENVWISINIHWSLFLRV